MEVITMNETTCARLETTSYQLDTIISNPSVLVTLATVLSVISAFAFFANLTVIVALIRIRFNRFTSRTKNSSSNTQVLIMSMALSDAMLGGFIMPLGVYNIVQNRRWELGHNLCNVREVLDIILTAVSFLHVTCMALDRYLAICRPLYFRTITFKTSLIMISMCWVLPTSFITVVTLSGWHQIGIENLVFCSRLKKICVFQHNKPFLFVTVFIFIDIPIILTFILYILVLREVVRYHSRKPKSFYHTEKNILHNTKEQNKALNTQDFNITYLSETVNEAPKRLTSKDIRNINSVWELLQSFTVYCCRKNTRSSNSESADTLKQSKEFSESFQREPMEEFQAEDVENDFTIERHETSSSTWKKIKIEDKETNLAETSYILPMTNVATSPRIGHDQVNLDSCLPQNKQPRNGVAAGKSATRLNMKAVTTIGIIVVCFTICYMPLNIAVTVAVYVQFTNPIVSIFVLWIAYVNSIFNPIIYCCQRSIRGAVWSLLCPCRSS